MKMKELEMQAEFFNGPGVAGQQVYNKVRQILQYARHIRL